MRKTKEANNLICLRLADGSQMAVEITSTTPVLCADGSVGSVADVQVGAKVKAYFAGRSRTASRIELHANAPNSEGVPS